MSTKTKTEGALTVSEAQAATILGIDRTTLRYYRIRGYLTEGIVKPAEARGVVPPGRTSPLRYDTALLARVNDGSLPLFAEDVAEGQVEGAADAAEPGDK